MLETESTWISLQSLPQSAVVIAMCNNYSEVVNLKRLRSRIVHLPSSSFSLNRKQSKNIFSLLLPEIIHTTWYE